MYDYCTGAVVIKSDVAQELCLNLSGTPVVGDVVSVSINNCTYSFTVNDAAVPDSGTPTVGSFGVVSVPASGNMTITDLVIGQIVVPTPVSVPTSPSVAASALNLANAMFAAVEIQEPGIVESITASQGLITISINAAAYNNRFGSLPNGEQFSFTNANLGVAYSATSGALGGGTLPDEDAQEQARQAIYVGLVAQMGMDQECNDWFSASVGADENCGIRLCSTFPGIPLEVAISTAGTSMTGTVEVIQENSWNIPGATQQYIETCYPGDGIYIGMLAIQYTQNDEILTDIGSSGVVLSGRLQEQKNRLLIQELGGCCTSDPCLPKSTAAHNYLLSIEQLVCQGDYTKACQVLSAADHELRSRRC